jgi:FixJ family two-component response regulator
VVAIVDDDQGMRQAMRRVLDTEGFVTEMFDSAEAFLAAGAATRVQCLVLDIHLPGISGPELHRRLLSMGRRIPTVYVTARGPEASEHCLIKPFPAETLIEAVNRSIAK